MADSSDRDLHLNTLHRFSKHSEKLVLEVHGHCEIPAGCGGVVLRWRNPDAGLPVAISLATSGRVSVFLDGVQLKTGRSELSFADHVLAVHVREIAAAAPALFALATTPDSPNSAFRDEALPELSSAADGSWLATAHAPPPKSWHQRDFDSSRWSRLRAGAIPEDLPDGTRRRYERMRDRGAEVLALPQGAAEVWIRKTFTIDREYAAEVEQRGRD